MFLILDILSNVDDYNDCLLLFWRKMTLVTAIVLMFVFVSSVVSQPWLRLLF